MTNEFDHNTNFSTIRRNGPFLSYENQTHQLKFEKVFPLFLLSSSFPTLKQFMK